MSEKTAYVNVRIQKEVKEQAQELFNSLGMDLSTAVNVFLKQSITNGGIPFEIKKARVPSKRLLAAMAEADRLQSAPVQRFTRTLPSCSLTSTRRKILSHEVRCCCWDRMSSMIAWRRQSSIMSESCLS